MKAGAILKNNGIYTTAKVFHILITNADEFDSAECYTLLFDTKTGELFSMFRSVVKTTSTDKELIDENQLLKEVAKPQNVPAY